MIHAQIQIHLDRLARRLRSRWSGTVLGIVWLFLAGLFWQYGPTWFQSGEVLDRLFLIAVSAAALILVPLVVISVSQFLYRRDLELAKRVERRFPDLDRRLETAIERQLNSHHRRDVFATQLEKETLQHAYTNRWYASASGFANAVAWLFQFAALALFVLGVGNALKKRPEVIVADSAPTIDRVLELIVEPIREF